MCSVGGTVLCSSALIARKQVESEQKLQVDRHTECSFFYRALLQKRPKTSLILVATSYSDTNEAPSR